MKKLLFLLLLPLIVSLQSCVVSEITFCIINNEEIIRIDSEDKGAYSLKLDLHDFIIMAGKGSPEPDNSFFNSIKIDTTVSFKEYLKNYPIKLTDQESAMFKNGSVNIYCDFSKSKQMIEINLFYDNNAQLDFAREHVFNFVSKNVEFVFSLLKPNDGFSDVDQNMVAKLGIQVLPPINFNVINSDKEASVTEIPEVKGFNPVGKNFDLKMGKESIQNSLINLPMFEKAIASNRSLQSIKTAGSELDSVLFKTTFILTNKIEDFKGQLNYISPDRKKITFKSSLSDILNNPIKSEFFIKF